MTEQVVLVEHRGTVAIVTLNRPHAMNALSSALRAALAEAFRTLDADPQVAAIVLTGAGDRAFTAGLDLKELGSTPGGVFDAVGADPTANPVAAILGCRKPVIGAINGVAVTGGFEVALACDILICSETARFADTHAKVQVMPGWGLSQRLPRIIGPGRAKEMSFTARFVDARTAAEWGLVNRVVPAERLLDEAVAMAETIAGNSAEMVAAYKALIDEGLALPFGDALEMERSRSQAFNAVIDAGDIEALREAVQASNRA
ncbi:enoyl-CoA hydratase [Sphingomonas colocasiae]|uniref:Enoyl-CoA hydratase n=1 Tax=Sphingomonas colocasiae TaxID=1848973 RepID=A0ABS7PSV5_9SPHN|nr:enoyl-CoA hydratase [Sphingomonas colocasiae]MBY8824346.1 enoyl-CoA hydratase [Sphingomonas colocasiae]